MAVGKNIKWGRGEGALKVQRKSRLKNLDGEEYQVVENYIYP